MFGIFKEDPEKLRVAAKLSEQLDNVDDWRVSDSGDGYVKHKIHNIQVRYDRICEPEHIWMPSSYKKIIKKKIKKIYRNHELEQLGFIYNYLDGKYPLTIRIHGISDEQKEWLKENSTEDQYIKRGSYIYISDETLAMGYKLAWL